MPERTWTGAPDKKGEDDMEVRNLTCIGCPMGCPLKVTMKDGKVEKIEGNTCKRGADYGEKEVTNPTRIVTSTVRVKGGQLPVVSVKTAADIPKGKIRACMRELKNVTVDAPVYIGMVVLRDAAGTGVDIVATKSMAER
jgi:CxxC motif-containing protein